MIKSEDLELFVAIARSGSLSGGARQLHMVKSAVSQRLAALEKQLDTRLIQRTTRHMSLTEAGQTFLAHAEKVLDALAETEAAVRADQAALRGRLRFAAPLSYGLLKLQPVIARFLRDYPEITMEVDFSDRRVDLVEEGYDLALRIGALAPSSLIARRLGTVKRVVAASPRYWAEHGVPEHPNELEILDCLRYRAAQLSDTVAWSSNDGIVSEIRPRIKLISTSGDFLVKMAVEGCGYLIEPAFLMAEELASGKLQEVLGAVDWQDFDMHLLFPPGRMMTARTRRFAECIATALQN